MTTQTDNQDHIALVRWAPRVSQVKIRRLYETDAQGITDEELIDDVGYALYLRCQSILQATEAANGRVKFPCCGNVITRKASGKESHAELLVCGSCDWQVTWGRYQKTFHHKQLHSGGATEAFVTFITRFDAAHSAFERLFAIDRLIHSFHTELAAHFTRPAGVNLIEGRMEEVLQFLDNLTYGDTPKPEITKTRERYQFLRSRP